MGVLRSDSLQKTKALSFVFGSKHPCCKNILFMPFPFLRKQRKMAGASSYVVISTSILIVELLSFILTNAACCDNVSKFLHQHTTYWSLLNRNEHLALSKRWGKMKTKAATVNIEIEITAYLQCKNWLCSSWNIFIWTIPLETNKLLFFYKP